MLTIESLVGLVANVPAKATRILIKDYQGNPIVAVIEGPNKEVYISTKGDDSFEAFLKNFGLRDTTIVTRMDVNDLKRVIL